MKFFAYMQRLNLRGLKMLRPPNEIGLMMLSMLLAAALGALSAKALIDQCSKPEMEVVADGGRYDY